MESGYWSAGIGPRIPQQLVVLLPSCHGCSCQVLIWTTLAKWYKNHQSLQNPWYEPHWQSGTRTTSCYRIPSPIPADKISRFHRKATSINKIPNNRTLLQSSSTKHDKALLQKKTGIVVMTRRDLLHPDSSGPPGVSSQPLGSQLSTPYVQCLCVFVYKHINPHTLPPAIRIEKTKTIPLSPLLSKITPHAKQQVPS